jgi:hypothetical protein
MKHFVFIILIIACVSCVSSKVIPLKGTYSNGNFEAVTSTPKDKVWDNIIDFFTKKGLSIRIIDRSSGLIISNESELTWTYEDKNGKLVKPDAFIAISKVISLSNNKPVNPTMITGEWNIRIKDASGGQTSIAVNLVNPKYITPFNPTATAFKQGAFQSTGIFEKTIYDIVK